METVSVNFLAVKVVAAYHFAQGIEILTRFAVVGFGHDRGEFIAAETPEYLFFLKRLLIKEAISNKTWSPIMWPWVSLISLKLSMSSIQTETGVPSSRLWLMIFWTC
jgi:hypothetical protein